MALEALTTIGGDASGFAVQNPAAGDGRADGVSVYQIQF
jgi:hypothetical protein